MSDIIDVIGSQSVYHGPGGKIVRTTKKRAESASIPTISKQLSYNILDYGNQTAIAAAFINAVRDIDQKGGGTLFIPAGNYNWEQSVQLILNNPIKIVSDEGAYMDASSVPLNSPILYLRGYGINNYISQWNLTADVSANTNTITVNADTVTGQIIYITCYDYCQTHFPPANGDDRYFFSPTRIYYTQGEFNIIEKGASAGQPVKLRFPLRHSYISTINAEQVTTVRLLKPVRLELSGLTFERPIDPNNNTWGIRFEGCYQSSFNNLYVKGCTEFGLSLRDSFSCDIESCYSTGDISTNIQVSAGIFIESCEQVEVSNCRCEGMKTGLDLGGQSGPNRYISIHDNVFYTNYTGSGSFHGINTHSNNEKCSIYNNICSGVIIQGRDITVSNNTLITPMQPLINIALEIEKTNYIRITGNRFLGKSGFNNPAIRIRSSETTGRTYDIQDLEISHNEVYDYFSNFVSFVDNITSGSHTINIKYLKLLYNVAKTNSTTFIVNSNAFVTRSIEYAFVIGNRFISETSYPYIWDYFSSIQYLWFYNNYAETSNNTQWVFRLSTNICSILMIDNNHFKGTVTAYRNDFTATNFCRITDNLFENFTNSRGIYAPAPEGIVHGNKFINCTGTAVYPTTITENWLGKDIYKYDPVSKSPESSTENVIVPTTSNIIPLKIQGATNQTADMLQILDSLSSILFRVDKSGWLGIGKQPSRPLHVYRQSNNANDLIRIEVGDSFGVFIDIINTERTWRIGQDSSENFILRDVTNGNTTIITVEKGATQNSFYVNALGNIAMNHNSPSSKLHIKGSNPNVPVLILDGEATQVAPILRIRDSAGNSLFSISKEGHIQSSQTSSGTTLGNVVAKLPIYTVGGSLVGYIPIYNTIT